MLKEFTFFGKKVTFLYSSIINILQLISKIKFIIFWLLSILKLYERLTKISSYGIVIKVWKVFVKVNEKKKCVNI